MCDRQRARDCKGEKAMQQFTLQLLFVFFFFCAFYNTKQWHICQQVNISWRIGGGSEIRKRANGTGYCRSARWICVWTSVEALTRKQIEGSKNGNSTNCICFFTSRFFVQIGDATSATTNISPCSNTYYMRKQLTHISGSNSLMVTRNNIAYGNAPLTPTMKNTLTLHKVLWCWMPQLAAEMKNCRKT